MTHEILDTTKKQPLRKPIPWWRAGLLGGIACPVVAILVNVTYTYSPLLDAFSPGSHIWLLFISLLALPIAVARVAMFGSHYQHFYQVQLTGLFASTIIMVIIGTILIYVSEYDFELREEVVFIIPVFYAITVILSSILWLFPGHWKKYRNQVIR